jgi:hypothetical protein
MAGSVKQRGRFVIAVEDDIKLFLVVAVHTLLLE